MKKNCILGCESVKYLRMGVLTIFGINYLKENFSHEQRYLIVAIFALFLPFYMTAAIHALLFFRLIYTGEIKQAYKEIKGSRYILIFSALSLLVSAFYKNWMGVGMTLGIFMLFSLTLYYRRHVTEALFHFLVNCIIYMSVACAIYALVEYVGILNKFDLDELEIIVFNSPKYRINSVFFNANYYAMMINFFVGLAFYKILKILKTKEIRMNFRRLAELVVIILLNLFTLYLTGCRTAWPALMLGIAMMLLINKNYKTCGLIGVGMAGIIGFFAMYPKYIPRVTNIVKYLGVRMGIWKTAIANIKTHPLFGEGPFTYWLIYPKYHSHPTQHSHNIFIDPLLCFGVVGIASIIPFFAANIERLHALHKLHRNDTLVGLILGYIVMTVIHGMLDYTIFFVQTGFLFFFVISSFDIYKDEIDRALDKA